MPPTIAVIGGTILTVTRGAVQNGTILLDGGKIAAVGAAIPVPADAEIVDATGRFVSPGIIDCHAHIATELAPAVPRWRSVNEVGTTVSSMTGIEDVFDPSDVDIYRNLAGGVTVANLLHGSANPIGGKNLVIKLRWGRTHLEDFVVEDAPPGIKLALGENPKIGGGGAGIRPTDGPLRYPATRMGVEHVIRDGFTRAKAYQAEWQQYERRKGAGESVLPPRRDLQLEPLAEVLERRRLVHAHVYRADDILALMRLAEDFGFRIATLHHALEAYKVADEIAAHGASVSAFADWWGYRIEAIDGIPYNAAMMARHGVLVSIHSDSAEHARRLNTEAAKTIKWGGVSEDDALAFVTINPARQLGIDARVGSLEGGKDADVVIWSRHPLSSYAIVDRVYIDGRRYYDRNDDRKRLAALAQEKHALMLLERGGRSEPPAAGRAPVPEPRRGDGRAEAGRTAHAVSAPRARACRNGILAITNARIFPISRRPVERGTLVMRDGIIESVGPNAGVPAGARVIEASGCEVYPGFIDARSTLGLTDPGPAGFGDANEILDFNPQLRAQIAYHSDSPAIRVARVNGVTAAAVTPRGGILGGQIAVMNLDGRTWEESTLSASAGIAFQFPCMAADGAGDRWHTRAYSEITRERDSRLDRLARLLDAARACTGGDHDARRDLVLDSLVPVVEKRVPLFTLANREQDIVDAVGFAERANVSIVIAGGLEAAMCASLLRERNVPVILGPVLTLPMRDDLPHQATYAAAGELVRAGVKIAFATGDAHNVRLLPYHAAKSVAWGLAREDALRALTLNAAEILGVGDRVGSLEPGKLGNVVITRGDPLEVRTTVAHVIIAGRDVGLENRHLALYERYAGAAAGMVPATGRGARYR